MNIFQIESKPNAATAAAALFFIVIFHVIQRFVYSALQFHAMTRNRLMFDNNFEDLEKEKYPLFGKSTLNAPCNHNSKQQTSYEHNHTIIITILLSQFSIKFTIVH